MSLMGYTQKDIEQMLNAVENSMDYAESDANTDVYNNLVMTADFLIGLIEEERV